MCGSLHLAHKGEVIQSWRMYIIIIEPHQTIKVAQYLLHII
jgi:hypothetical protein